MRLRRLTSVVAALTVAASCSSRDAANGTPAGSGAGDSTESASAVPWFDGAEPLLLAPAQSSDRALVVAADSLAPDLEDGDLARAATLVRLDGTLVTARVSVSSASEGCVDAALSPAPSAPWGIGFVGRAPTAMPVDSIRAISPKDSAALAPMIFRLASSVPNSAGGRFNGLPFSLADLWRVRLSDGATLIVAMTKRQINQEDSPLEERTFVVAQPDAQGELVLLHSARSSGPEETVEGTELLAAVSFAADEALLVLAHDYGDETAYSILERTGSRTWKPRWSSRRFSC